MTLVKIGKVAKILGVTTKTLVAWERSGELIPDRRSRGGVRYYDLDRIRSTGLGNEDLPTVGYAHVPGPGQGESLTQQEELLEGFCVARGWRHEIISDSGRESNPAGSGPGAGLRRLLKLILYKRIRRLVITHKDRLLRFGSELVFTLCEIQKIEIVVLNQGDDPPTLGEEDLAQDIELRRMCERLIDGAYAPGVPQASPTTGDGALHTSGKPSVGGGSNAGGNGKASDDLGTE